MMEVFLSDLPKNLRDEACEVLGGDFTIRFNNGEVDLLFCFDVSSDKVVGVV